MLPRQLTEELCSVSSVGHRRLTFSVVWKMDKDGNISSDEWIGRSVVQPAARLSFDQAQVRTYVRVLSLV